MSSSTQDPTNTTENVSSVDDESTTESVSNESSFEEGESEPTSEGTETSANEIDVESDSSNELSEEDAESEELPELEDVIKERDQLRTQVEELQGRLYTISDAYQKKTTEVDNTRKRLERMNEINQAQLRGKVVSSMFTPFENLKRSVDACSKGGVDEGLTGGLTMVKDEFWKAFEQLGLEEVPGAGSLFNPNIHEALTTMPVQDPVQNDTVVQVYSTGYRINDTVVRTAQVIVGKYYAPPKAETSEEEEVSNEPEEGVDASDQSNTKSDDGNESGTV